MGGPAIPWRGFAQNLAGKFTAWGLYVNAELKARLQTIIDEHWARHTLSRTLDDVEVAMRAGVSIGRALADNFNRPLLSYLERAAGLPITERP